MANDFGTYAMQLRVRLHKTLRQFCVDNSLDPGNVSKLERGLSAPPQSEVALKKYAHALQLKPQTPEWEKFFALAATAAGKIPKRVLADKEVMAQLPVLFMALSRRKPSREKLKRIVKIIKES